MVREYCHRDLPEQPPGVTRAREQIAKGKNLLGGSLLFLMLIGIVNIVTAGAPVFEGGELKGLELLGVLGVAAGLLM